MTQYIDKDILLKAIEVKRNGLIALMNQIPYASNYPIWSSNVDLLDEVKRGIDIIKVKEVDEQKERINECPCRKVVCTMYTDKMLECNGACSWVVDYPRLKELKAQKGE